MPPGFRRARSPHDRKVIVARSFPPLSAAPLRGAATQPGRIGLRDPRRRHRGRQPRDADPRRRARDALRRRAAGLPRQLPRPDSPDRVQRRPGRNSPEIAAAIEAAVQDGMDVINLSIGEPEIPPSRDLVVRAIDGAFRGRRRLDDLRRKRLRGLRRGSVSSPGSAASAITVGATTVGRRWRASPPRARRPCRFASPRYRPRASTYRGAEPEGPVGADERTSMAAPHVAGAGGSCSSATRTWTPAQVKSALVTTGQRTRESRRNRLDDARGRRVRRSPRADRPLVFASPSTLSFGFLKRGRLAAKRVAPADAGGGAGSWAVSHVLQGRTGVRVSASRPSQCRAR